ANIVTTDKNIRVSLGDAPSGVKLDSDKLSWTPAPENIGTTRLALRLVAGDVKTDQQIELVVRQQSSRLPFAVGSYATTPDGSKLIVIAAGPAYTGPPTKTSRLAAIDLGNGAVLWDKELDFLVPSFIHGGGQPLVA